MIVGHTKFGPDLYFGVFKRRLKRNVETIEEIAEVVRLSSKHNIPQLVSDPDKPVVFYHWADFLDKVFRKIPNITKYHHVEFSTFEPGIVKLREFSTRKAVRFNMVKSEEALKESLHSMPEVCPSPGIYLFSVNYN